MDHNIYVFLTSKTSLGNVFLLIEICFPLETQYQSDVPLQNSQSCDTLCLKKHLIFICHLPLRSHNDRNLISVLNTTDQAQKDWLSRSGALHR